MPSLVLRSLADLLAPHDPALIAGALKNRQRLHLRTGNVGAFAALLPWPDLNALITIDRLWDSRVRAVRRGRDLPLEMFSVQTEKGRALVPEALQRLCRDGLSLVANRLHHERPAVGALCAMLHHRLGCDVGANAYASFGRESAFRPHHDRHDVLVLQLQGTKRWFCHGPVQGQPAGDGPAVATDPGPILWEGVLEPGDILFLPRGEVHHARIEGPASLHLTLGLHWPRMADLLRGLGQADGLAAFLDQDVLLYGDGDDLTRQQAQLRDLLHQAADSLDLRALVAAWQGRRPQDPVLNLGLADRVTPETWVEAAARQGDGATLAAGQPAQDPVEQAVLAALQAGAAQRVGELQALPGLEPQAVADAVARLALRSLVRLSDD